VVAEIGVFAADAKRTATVVCRTDCRIYELSENQAKQLFLQDRKFGFAMMRCDLSLIACSKTTGACSKPCRAMQS